MEPRIRYARTKDGVSIAFWTLGEGTPLVYIPNLIWSHAHLEWQFPEVRLWYERLAEARKLVRFDPRGTGLSQRDVGEYSLQAVQMDLEAVVERLRLETFALFGDLNAGPVAIAYAANHPERVSRLILWCSWARTADYKGPKTQMLESLQTVMDKDWETYTETRAHMGVGWSEGESAHRYAALMRECIKPEMAWKVYRAVDEDDVSPLLSQVTSPTLVLHRRQLYFWDVQVSQSLASRIPDARLAVLEGVASAPYLGDAESLLAAIDEFLGEGDEGEAEPAPPSGTAIILFADIVDSTELTERLGDVAFREKARELDGSLRAIIREADGMPVEGKLLGDGVLAVFTSARQAIEGALRCRQAGDECGLPLHLGVHAGDVIREEGNVYGGAVNIAARIAGESAAGEVLVSQTVRDLARTSAEVSFEDLGDRELKGVSEPVRVWAVRGEV